MTVSEFAHANNFKILSCPNPNREINGVYIGDLLSWVMAHAKPNNLWLTVMSNINVIAVASLVNISCIVLCDNVTLCDEVLQTAKQKGINVFSTALSSFDAAVCISGILK